MEATENEDHVKWQPEAKETYSLVAIPYLDHFPEKRKNNKL
jgi:hypothetical protein